jgi:ABC-type uncharacterized transport system permease subunit
MAGFEVIFRPAVFPNIRPAPPRVLVPESDPTQGLAVIGGSGGKLIDLQHSYSVSFSRQEPHREAARQFDVERVKRVDKDGKVNEDDYIDVERMKKHALATAEGTIKIHFATPPNTDNIETLSKDMTRKVSAAAGG